jgi:hypothetical protein
MVIVCLSCLFAVWVLYLHFRSESTNPVPLWAKGLFLVKLRFILCEKASIETLDQEEIEGEKVGTVFAFKNLLYTNSYLFLQYHTQLAFLLSRLKSAFCN